MFAFVSPFVSGFGKAFAGTAVTHRNVVPARVCMKTSPSMPFMEQPATLDDETIPGNVGFDPLGLSTIFDMKFMQVRCASCYLSSRHCVYKSVL